MMCAYLCHLILNIISLLKERKLLSYIVFSEAQCLSKWSYDYTPLYASVIQFSKFYDGIPRIAVTTTVTQKVMEDICRLALIKPRRFKIPINTRNVYYDVWFVDILPQPLDHLTEFIMRVLGFLNPFKEKAHDNFGIVYCKDKVTAELLKNTLIAAGIPAISCHYRLNKGTRRNVENQWLSGKVTVIVTTYDHGFIYKKPIKCKIYWSVPECIPKYHRLSVKSVTNNCRVYCRIYFSINEYSSVKMFIENNKVIDDPECIKERINDYDKLVTYCLSTKCRQAVISEYFGYVTDPCRRCDVCVDMDAVEVRALKFIAYSQKVKRIEYNICDINELLKESYNRNVEKESEKCSEEKSEICNVACRDISVDRNNSVAIVQYKDKQKSSPPNTQPCTKDYIHASPKSPVKHAEDNSNATGVNKLAITSSLPSIRSLNNELSLLSLEPCSSSSNIAKISTSLNSIQISSKSNVSHVKSRSENANSDVNVSKTEKKDRITMNDDDYCEVIFVSTERKERSRKRRKRGDDVDRYPTEFRSKRIKLRTENKPTAVTLDRRSEGTSDRDKRVEDNANESMSRAHATAEFLTNKYKLDKSLITLTPLSKCDSNKRSSKENKQ
ncbi:uncharacterized protein LOC144478789 isoform X2 [Augochlora pura]